MCEQWVVEWVAALAHGKEAVGRDYKRVALEWVLLLS